jgi:hypothetical protein
MTGLERGKILYGSKESRERLIVSFATPPDKSVVAYSRNKDRIGKLVGEYPHLRRPEFERDRFKKVYYRVSGVTRGDVWFIMRDKGVTGSQIAFIIDKPKNTVLGWVSHKGNDPGHVIPMTLAELKKVYDFFDNVRCR